MCALRGHGHSSVPCQFGAVGVQVAKLLIRDPSMANERPCEPATAGDEPVRTFRSAIGSPAYGQMLGPSLGAAAMILLLTMEWTAAHVFAAGVLVLAVAMLVWLLVGTRYRVGDGNLIVSTVYRRRRVALTDITSVKRVPHWQYPVEFGENFALSNKRILITHAESRIFVSPKDDKGFLTALGHPIDA